MNFLTPNEVVHFTHHDLDALGCILHTNYATPNNPKKHFHTNYRDIEEKVSEVYDYCTLNKPKLLLISDISFSSHKKLLQKLEDILEICPVIFLDHHEYTDNFFEDIKIKCIIDITKSATKITQDFFKTEGKNKNLDTLSNIINTFDIWQQNEKEFPLSLSVDNYFWALNNKLSIEQMAVNIKQDNYTLKGFKEFHTLRQQKTKDFIEKSTKKKLITSDGFFTVAFVDEYFNEIVYDEFSRGVEFVFIANSYGITRFRFNGSGKLNRTQKEEIKMKLINTLAIGHLNAYSAKIKDSNFDKIMKRVQEVYNILQPFKLELNNTML